MNKMNQKNINQLNYYQGPGEIAGIHFKSAAKDLSVSAWGMNVLEIKGGCQEYPRHHHLSDGQEEVYFVHKGSVDVHTDEGVFYLNEGDFLRVAAEVNRKLLPGPQGVTVIAMGGTPGKAYPLK